ncbi:MAG: nitroreductase family deazaflavin-dependent oxidoreductase [Actinobacteria bacterium]|nr:nitroreductase family deazaflavin-dependent oxidoreductase [Actinomycetota bacterium]
MVVRFIPGVMPYMLPYVSPRHFPYPRPMGSRAYDLVWGSALRATTVAHRFLDRVSGGRLMRKFPGGAQVVWITTLGRKSGEWRRTPLLGVPTHLDGAPGWGIAGSNAGQEKVPGWVFNVRAHVEGRIEIDGAEQACTFVEVHGNHARDIYAKLADTWSAYRMYERNIQREIPIFVAQFAGSTSRPS